MYYTSGTWTPKADTQDKFIEAWREFAIWASSMAGADSLYLTRNIGDSRRFVSFGSWQTFEQIRAWKANPEFGERMARVLQYTETFEPAELALIANAQSGTCTMSAPTLEPSGEAE
jgi:heme-degrading monooxygenase HmoA